MPTPTLMGRPANASQRRHKKQACRQSSQEEVIHDQETPFNRFHLRLSSDQEIDLRAGSSFRFFHTVLTVVEQFGQLAFGIVQVAKGAHFAGAGLNACRKLPAFEPLDTKIALIDYTLVLAKETSLLGTSYQR